MQCAYGDFVVIEMPPRLLALPQQSSGQNQSEGAWAKGFLIWKADLLDRHRIESPAPILDLPAFRGTSAD
jgi:hypothetical protein